MSETQESQNSVEKKNMAGLCERVLWLLFYQLLYQ